MRETHSFAAGPTCPHGGYELRVGTATDAARHATTRRWPRNRAAFNHGAPSTYMPRPTTPDGYLPPALVPSTPPCPLPRPHSRRTMAGRLSHRLCAATGTVEASPHSGGYSPGKCGIAGPRRGAHSLGYSRHFAQDYPELAAEHPLLGAACTGAAFAHIETRPAGTCS